MFGGEFPIHITSNKMLGRGNYNKKSCIYALSRKHPHGRVQRTQKFKLPSAEHPVLSKVLSFKPGVSQNMVLRASLTARNSA